VDWDQQQVRWPQGHLSIAWWSMGWAGQSPIIVEFDKQHVWDVSRRASCTRANTRPTAATAAPGAV